MSFSMRGSAGRRIEFFSQDASSHKSMKSTVTHIVISMLKSLFPSSSSEEGSETLSVEEDLGRRLSLKEGKRTASLETG